MERIFIYLEYITMPMKNGPVKGRLEGCQTAASANGDTSVCINIASLLPMV